MGYITEEGKQAMLRYKYKGEDRSLLYKHILSPWAQFCVDYFTPEIMAPNSITAVGLLFQIAAYVFLWAYCPTYSEAPPTWAVVFAGVALFIYSTMDNMDGKQARKVGASSPLGLLFDHGCDAINTAMVGTLSFMMATGSAAGGGLRIAFAIWAFVTTAFFMNTWEEYHIREFILPLVNGPSEGLMGTTVLFLVTAWRGQRVWHDEPTTFGALVPFVRPVLDRFRLLAGVSLAEPVTNVELLSVCAGLFLIVTCVMNSLTVCRYYIARSAPLSSHFNAFWGTLPMWLLLGAGSRWLFEARLSPVAAAHPHVWFMAGGAIFAEFTSRLMISHVCDQAYAPAYWPIALFGLAPALETLRSVAPHAYSTIAGSVPAAALEPQALLFVSAVAALAHLAFFFSTSVRTIAATLDIDVFDTTKQRTRAAEAAARKSS